MVAAVGLTKRFGDAVAVDGIDVRIHRGEAFGFLGPNGAGKTSTMRMIAALSPVSGGSLSVLGMDPTRDGSAVRARLGIVPQEDNLDNELTVRQNLLFYGRFFGLSSRAIGDRAEELLRFVELWERRDSPVQTLSGGMKRRLVIARALINEPDLVLLDEPTTGLDPQARQLVWDRLYRLKSQGVSLVLTTHYMDEAEQLCDRLVVMHGGRIVAEGAPQQLIETYVNREVVELRFPRGVPDDTAALEAAAPRAEVLADRVLLYTDDATATSAAVAGSGVAVAQTLTRRSTLEDVFLTLAGRTLTE
ncbi:ABC transporter ATP-binding protein [Euzebya sp.]|uniref:ABC transporter ATP-binding protein n=1 Tax=Euzebya sp. TaxID=1971409 RepID=UPI00351831D5